MDWLETSFRRLAQRRKKITLILKITQGQKMSYIFFLSRKLPRFLNEIILKVGRNGTSRVLSQVRLPSRAEFLQMEVLI